MTAANRSCGPATGWCANIEPGRPYRAGQCERCWLMAHNPVCRANWGVPGPPVPLTMPDPPKAGKVAALPLLPACPHEGSVREYCKTCNGPARHVRTCYHELNDAETCTRGVINQAVWSCADCPHHPANGYTTKKDDPAVGVVVGSYRWPELIDLQLHLIRVTCGPVPVLVSSDRAADASALEEVCKRHGADLTVSPEKLGHTAGDMAAYARGVHWASQLGLAVVAKLSQRMLVTRPRWLQDGAADLLASGLTIASRRCKGPDPFRTEAALLRVDAWAGSEAIAEAAAFRHGGRPKAEGAERQFLDMLGRRGLVYLPWELLAENRREKRAGVIWHHANDVAEYRRLASRFGVTLPEDFRVDGWGWELAAGEYSHG